MINYEASTINSNVTLLQKMNKIEKYLLDNQLGNVFVTYQTLADDRLSDSDIQELNDRVIGKGDLLIDNDGYLYVITGFNEHTIYIDYAHRIKLGDRLDQAELDLIQQMIDNTFKALNPISISDNSSISGNEPDDYHTVAIGTNINLQAGTNPNPPAHSVFIGYDLSGTRNTGDTSYNEKNVCIGSNAGVHGDKSVAIGYLSYVNGTGAVQLGEGTNNTSNSLQFQDKIIIDSNGNMQIKTGGTSGQILTKQSSAPNDYAWANPSTDLSNLDPISISDNNSITGNVANNHTIAIGKSIDLAQGTVPINPSNCIVIGNDDEISREYNISNNNDNIIIGNDNEISKGEKNIILGVDSLLSGSSTVPLKSSIAIGDDITMTGGGSCKIAIGYQAQGGGGDNNTISIGYKADGTTIDSIAIGSEAKTNGTDSNIAIGKNASTTGMWSVAIGRNAVIDSGAGNAVQLGDGTNSTSYSLQFRSTQIVDGNGKLNIPNGVNGTTGQVLTKLSNAENDYAWQTPQGGGSGSGKTFDIPMLINYTADESFSSIMNTPKTIVIDDQQTQQGLNLETSDPDFTDYEDKTSIYGYTYFTTGGDNKTQIVYGVISESSTPGTYEFTGLMPLAPEITI